MKELNGEVAAKASIAEPVFLEIDILKFKGLVIFIIIRRLIIIFLECLRADCVQRDRAQQNGEAEAQACAKNDGQVWSSGQVMVFRSYPIWQALAWNERLSGGM